MAMTKCRECSTLVSNEAKKCPSCGISSPAKAPGHGCLITIGIGCAFFIAILVTVQMTSPQPRPKTPDTPEQAAAKEARFQREMKAATGAITLRDMMRNPKTFELIRATAVPDWYCYEYRSQNGFGGMTIGFAVSNGTRVLSNDDGESVYQGHCRTPYGDDLTGPVNAALEATRNK